MVFNLENDEVTKEGEKLGAVRESDEDEDDKDDYPQQDPKGA